MHTIYELSHNQNGGKFRILSQQYAQGAKNEILVEQDWIASPTRILPIVEGGYMIHSTSGTTGTPKFYKVSQHCLNARIQRNNQTRGPMEAPTLIAYNVGSFIGVKSSVATLLNGATQMHLLASPDLTLFALRQFSFGYAYIPPAHLKDLRDHNEGAKSVALTRVNVGGSSIGTEFAKSCEESFGCEVICDYGSLETDTIASRRVTSNSPDAGYVGQVNPWFNATTGEDNQANSATGPQIMIQVPSEMRLQALDDDESPYSPEGWISTGDIGTFDQPTRGLFLQGRVSDLINVGGNKIAPSTLEEAAKNLPNISDIACFSLRNPNGYDDIGVALVPSEGFDVAGFSDQFSRISGATNAFRVFVVDVIPTSNSGKISRRELSQHFG